MNKSIKNLYCSECGSSAIEIKAWVDANTYEYRGIGAEDDCWCDTCRNHTKPATLKKLWKLFSKVPINDNDEIEERFLNFDAGTSRFDVWHWFDERCPNNLHDDLIGTENE